MRWSRDFHIFINIRQPFFSLSHWLLSGKTAGAKHFGGHLQIHGGHRHSRTVCWRRCRGRRPGGMRIDRRLSGCLGPVRARFRAETAEPDQLDARVSRRRRIQASQAFLGADHEEREVGCQDLEMFGWIGWVRGCDSRAAESSRERLR